MSVEVDIPLVMLRASTPTNTRPNSVNPPTQQKRLSSYLENNHNHDSIVKYMNAENIRLVDKDERDDRSCVQVILNEAIDPAFLLRKYFDSKLSAVILGNDNYEQPVSDEDFERESTNPNFRIKVDIQDFALESDITETFQTLQAFEIDSNIRLPFASLYCERPITRMNLESSNLLQLVLGHPLIVAYLISKVNRITQTVSLLMAIYFSFLVCFSYHCTVLAKETINYKLGFHEVYILLTATLGIIYHICQMAALRFRIILDIENLFMLITEVCSICVIVAEQVNLSWAKKFMAVGMLVGWMELLFLAGKLHKVLAPVSFRLLSAIRNVLKYAWAWGLLLLGFQFAFRIVLEESYFPQADNKNQTDIWSLPFFVKLMTMTIGEFDFDDFSAAVAQEHRFIGFVMFVLLLLILTISMFNIFIAVVLSDQDSIQNALLYEKLFGILNFIMTINNVTKTFNKMKAHIWKREEQNNPKDTIDTSAHLYICIHGWCKCDLSDKAKQLYFPPEYILVTNVQ